MLTFRLGLAGVVDQDLDVDSTGPHERRVQSVGMVGGHDQNASFLARDAVQSVEKAAIERRGGKRKETRDKRQDQVLALNLERHSSLSLRLSH